MSGVPQRQCSTTVGATPTDLKKSFTCHECGKAFNSVWYLKQHAVKHSKDRPFTCKYCSRTYRFRSNLYQHKCPQRDLASGQSQKASRPKKKQRIDEEDRQLHSSGCLPPADTITRPMASVQDGANGHLCLLNDVQTSYGDHKFDIYGAGAGDAGTDTGHKCYRCCMVFPSQEYLIRHLSWHSAEERKMQCSRCSELFENELLHDAHQQLHSLDAAHMCTFCLGKFCHRLALKRHMVRCGAQRSGGSLSTSNSGSTYSPQHQHQHHHQQTVEQTPPFTPFNEFNDMSSVGSSSAGSSGFSQTYPDVTESCLLTPYAAAASTFGPNADIDWAASSSYMENSVGYVENGAVPRQTMEAEDCWYGFDQAFVQSAAPADLSWNGMTPLAGAQCPLSSTAAVNNGEVLLTDGWQYDAAVSNYAANGDASHAEVQKLDEYLATGYPYAASMDPVLMFNNTVGGQEPPPPQPPAPQQQTFEGGVMGGHCAPFEPTSSEVTTGRCHPYVSRLEELTCATCSLLFDSLEALHNHFIRAHVLEELGTCRDGGGAGTMPSSGRCAASQEAENPTDWELLPTLCPICSVNFEGEEALRAHILSDHRPDKRFNCATCGQAFNRRQSWKRHVSACVARKNGDVDKSTAGDQLTNGSTPPPPSAGGGVVDGRSGELKCRHCSKVFMVKRYLKQHENSQHRASVIKGVEDCGGGGPTVAVGQQDAGKEVVDSKEEQALVSCPLCPKQFSVVKLLKQHVSFHARANSL